MCTAVLTSPVPRRGRHKRSRLLVRESPCGIPRTASVYQLHPWNPRAISAGERPTAPLAWAVSRTHAVSLDLVLVPLLRLASAEAGIARKWDSNTGESFTYESGAQMLPPQLAALKAQIETYDPKSLSGAQEALLGELRLLDANKNFKSVVREGFVAGAWGGIAIGCGCCGRK